MASTRAPKQWSLTRNETVTTFESWRQNLLYILSLDENFGLFLKPDSKWKKKSATDPLRSFTDDGVDVEVAKRKTAVQKNTSLDLMLGQIANFCPIISRNSIVKQSTSLSDIWQKIREHFGFQSSGAHFLDLTSIKLESGERHEDLFQRLQAFFEDNLLTVDGRLLHHGVAVSADEDMSPTLENTIIAIWLQTIHPGLPQLVKQRYGPELRNKTLASLKSEISQCLPSLLDELRGLDDSRAMRTFAPRTYSKPDTGTYKARSSKSCVLCVTAKRPGANTHYLSECKYLPEPDRRYFSRACATEADPPEYEHVEDDTYTRESDSFDGALLDKPDSQVRRVDIIQSPYLNCFYESHPVKITLDTGATTNMVSHDLASKIGLPISHASQMARQADGVTPLDVVGEVHCVLSRGSRTFQLDALVVKRLDVDVLAGNPFLVSNDIATRPAKRQIVIGGSQIVYYGAQYTQTPTARRTQATLLRSPCKVTLLPGEYIQVKTPESLDPDASWALEPRYDTKCNMTVEPERAWPSPQEIDSINNDIRITNDTSDPIQLHRGDHFCQIRQVVDCDSNEFCSLPADTCSSPPATKPPSVPRTPFSSNISVDPDSMLPSDIKQRFVDINKQFDSVFNPSVSRYNGASGNIEAVVNMGPTLPPQQKGRLPSYNRDTMDELQNKFDELESAGVFAKPEDVQVNVEYLNISFLVRKPSGGSRLVTSFGQVGRFCKPSPSLMPSVDGVLQDISRWRYLIVTDLKHAFYQIPLSKSSMKYCGVCTPYKGIRVYTRAAMGMPGSETCLEELMSRVLGSYIQQGWVTKIADDLYVGGNTPEELLEHWTSILQSMHDNHLCLNAPKTIITPKTTTVLGWIWSCGTLQASPHKVSVLTSVSPPETVQGLRSFIGAFKVLSRVLYGYAALLHPLERATAGCQSRDRIKWDDELLSAFSTAQKALGNCKVITVPRPTDLIWLVTDASVKLHGVAATMYVRRGDKVLLAGFFNAKLRGSQGHWLPCEREALGIASAVKHFSPYLIQSHSGAHVLTDSKPCVQAYLKLMRGEFSASARVSTFLASVSRYKVTVSHISGIANAPSDYASRNPSSCSDQSCQVCKFVIELEDSVVRATSVSDVLGGTTRMPFTSRAAWLATQRECDDLRRVHSYLSCGTRPQRKAGKLKDVKRYLQNVSIASDGLLVVMDTQPFQPSRERFVVPRNVLDGLLTAIHLRFSHPSAHQMKKIISRYFFALDLDKSIHAVCDSCHHCRALKSVPESLIPQTSEEPPDAIGVSYSLDVMKRYRQLFLVLRETVSSFTSTAFITNEQHATLRDAIVQLCSTMRFLQDSPISIRVDPAPGLVALVDDQLLKSLGISMVVGRPKNPNKNPVAERAIEELGLEILRITPEGGPVTPVTLALATRHMNTRIRRHGLSAQEIWTQRDQITGQCLPIDDKQLILKQHFERSQNHGPSALSKSHGKPLSCHSSQISTGDLVYLKSDKEKTRSRDKYIVVNIDSVSCTVRKFTSSQLRSKTYCVPLTDIYPVLSNTLTSGLPLHGPTHSSDTVGHTCDDAHVTPSHIQVQPHHPHDIVPYLPPAPPPEIVLPPDPPPSEVTRDSPSREVPCESLPVDRDTTYMPDISPTDSESDSDAECSATGRTPRIKRPPAWVQSGDWDLS